MYIKSIEKVGIYGVTVSTMFGHPHREESYWFGEGASSPSRAHAETTAREKAAAS
jgi:hypothetical protein